MHGPAFVGQAWRTGMQTLARGAPGNTGPRGFLDAVPVPPPRAGNGRSHPAAAPEAATWRFPMNAAVLSYSLTQPVSRFLGSPKELLIDGEWVPAASGKTFPVYDPATGRVSAEVAEGDREDIGRAVKAARRAFESGPWPALGPAERGKIIWRIGDAILEHLDELAELESLDNGKPISVAKAADVPLAADMFHYMAGWATKHRRDHDPAVGLVYPGRPVPCLHRPRAHRCRRADHPWNFPLLMAAWKLAPALAMGCTVVLKVAEETPLSALRLGELLLEAGLPKGVVNIVTGFGETAGAALAAHPGVDKVAFTGSTEVGKLIVRAAANDLKKVSLELGGKSPNIILKDADLDVAIPGAASAIFFNHGQCCCAGSRLYVEEPVFDRVVEGVAEAAKKIKLGPGLDPKTEMGPDGLRDPTQPGVRVSGVRSRRRGACRHRR